MSTIWLVGMPGSGKTSVGRRLAEYLGTDFTDTDDLIEEIAGVPVPAIWDEHGESEFRELEARAIAGLEGRQGVIASGGGAILDARNRVVIHGIVVWLQATPATIAARLEGDTYRPLLAGVLLERLTETAIARESIYAGIADHVVVTDGRSVEEVVAEVAELWPN